ncbi:membrane protein [Geotalea uraniireducens]|uniref:Membrane protein n=1 Tax=Geotalea uraniireducens TaxID=351604 RepID=A0ABM8EKC5_9BACT|nr:tail protein X [Geotalea uraniireducens]BDV42445.1 membrane protein [Geotalea uraniireducens]
MKTDILEHITSDGERWDWLAWEYYGDASRYEPIIAANPEVMITPVLPAGIKLLIPIIADADLVDTEDLPPWKR